MSTLEEMFAGKVDRADGPLMGRVMVLLGILVEARKRGREDMFEKNMTSVMYWVCQALTPHVLQLQQNELLALVVLSHYAETRDPEKMLTDFTRQMNGMPAGSMLMEILRPNVERSIQAHVADWDKPAVKCDGDHGGPPCADKDCWKREEIDAISESVREQLRAMGLK